MRYMLAARALTELVRWLQDDDHDVRHEARESIHRCLQIAYTGDRPEPPQGLSEKFLAGVDRMLKGFLVRFIDPDKEEPSWAKPAGLRAIRGGGIALVLVSAIVASLLLWSGHLLWVFLPVTLLAFADTLEGSFARVMFMRDAQISWLSCVASHAGDLLIMIGMAGYAFTAGHETLSFVVLLSALVTLTGSLVRVSGLQAGYRFWRSPIERFVRYSAVIVFTVAGVAGSLRVGAITASVMLFTLGILESGRALRAILRRPVPDGWFIFLAEQGAMCWGFGEEDEARPDATLLERPSAAVSAEGLLGTSFRH